jgi:thymidylate synthase (FAD)
MRVIKPSVEILFPKTKELATEILKVVELGGRNCYKSEDKICEGSYNKIIGMLRTLKHESVLEHGNISVRMIGSRAFTHQLIRHRLAAYSQESQRYVNYSKNKFNNEVTFIEPFGFEDRSPERQEHWKKSMEAAEKAYFEDIKLGGKAEQAREHLPNSCKTEIVVTMNLRAWRHFFKMRCDKHAQLEIRMIAKDLLAKMHDLMPVIFEDLAKEYLT